MIDFKSIHDIYLYKTIQDDNQQAYLQKRAFHKFKLSLRMLLWILLQNNLWISMSDKDARSRMETIVCPTSLHSDERAYFG